MSDVTATAAITAPAQPAPASSGLGHAMWSHGSFSFKDLLDIVNPLQHLPGVGSIYRYLTGDEPAAGTRVIGDSLYGGPIGFGVSVVSTALFTDDSGQDLGERLLADVFGTRNHDSTPTLGAPQVATADGQPATPPPANQPAAGPQGTPAPTVAALSARGIASASAPMSLAMPVAATPQSSPQILASTPARPIAMDQLFRSTPVAPAAPEQAFMAQASQFQRQINQGRGTNGAVLNNHPVPLELSSNLQPVMPAGGHLASGPGVASAAGPTSSQAQALKSGPGSAPNQSALAQKMIDALNKYEQLKRQEAQQDNADKPDQAKVDLAL